MLICKIALLLPGIESLPWIVGVSAIAVCAAVIIISLSRRGENKRLKTLVAERTNELEYQKTAW